PSGGSSPSSWTGSTPSSTASARRCPTAHHDAPIKDESPGDLEEVEVTEPTHPLFGRRFQVLSITRPPGRLGHVLVAYRHGARLRIPVLATNLAPTAPALPRTKLTRAALLDLLSLVKECEVTCPDQPNVSGADAATT